MYALAGASLIALCSGPVVTLLWGKNGGFFHYVNSLRLRYADEYRAAHPNASVTEIADASGFGSRQSCYSVKEEMEIEKNQ